MITTINLSACQITGLVRFKKGGVKGMAFVRHKTSVSKMITEHGRKELDCDQMVPELFTENSVDAYKISIPNHRLFSLFIHRLGIAMKSAVDC
jgi:hypothetical protein